MAEGTSSGGGGHIVPPLKLNAVSTPVRYLVAGTF